MKEDFKKNGYTLAEMIVVVGIISMILSVVVFSYGKFSDKLALNASSQEIFAAIREAQIYGTSAKQTTSGTADFNYAYGIYFDLGSPSTYIVFSDKNANHKYDAGSGCGNSNSECIDSFTLRNGITMTSICDSLACPPSAASGATALHITFLRPSTDALIYFSSPSTVYGPYDTGKVLLTSPKGKAQWVIVNITGQILAQ